jgi:hypothetical protein
MDEILKQLLERNIEVKLTKDGYYVEGFYKSSGIILKQVGEEIIATQRYKEEDKIYDFDSLVRLNYCWWERSKDRYDGWKFPDRKWVNDFVRLGLGKIETVEVFVSAKR